jgi:hypothetical protein
MTLPADAAKVAVVAPEATVTLAGTVTAALLLDNVTTVFPEAALFSVTVQVEVAPLVIDDELQAKELTCAGAFTVKVVWADPL